MGIFYNFAGTDCGSLISPSVAAYMEQQALDTTTMLKTQSKSKYIIAFAHIGALLTVTAWGTSFLCTKILMGQAQMTPVEIYFYRFFAAYLILLLFTCRHLFCHSFRDEMTMALCGICSGSLYFITENYALTLTTTANVSLLASISPIFTTFLAAAVFRQRLKAPVLIGSAIAFVGVGCIIFSHGSSFEIRPAGDLLALSASLCWAIYAIAIKRLLPFYSSMFISRKLFFYGVITALPMLFIQHGPLHWQVLFDFDNPHYLMNFLFLVLLCSIGAYLVWNEVMKYLGPVTCNNYLYIQPVVTMIAGYFVLGEDIYMLGYLGCVLIIGGLIISDKFPDVRKSKH